MSTKVSKLDNFSENFNLNANYMTSVRSIYTKPFLDEVWWIHTKGFMERNESCENEVSNLAIEVTNVAIEVTNLAIEVTNLAFEVTNESSH